MFKSVKNIIFTLLLVVLVTTQVSAQQGTSPVPINWILVTFNSAPSSLSVVKAPLKYNKDFALSMQVDDGDLSIFSHAFPVFEGGSVNGTTYPGMYYTDGCGNYHNFKMSSSVYLFSNGNLNGPDIHLDNSSGFITWDQMNSMYNNGWGIMNHAVNTDESSDPSFMNYSI